MGQWCVRQTEELQSKDQIDILHDVGPIRRYMSKYGPIPDNHVFVYPKSINGVNEIVQHAISFTLLGTLVIFGTPCTMICDRREIEGPPNRTLSMGP